MIDHIPRDFSNYRYDHFLAVRDFQGDWFLARAVRYRFERNYIGNHEGDSGGLIDNGAIGDQVRFQESASVVIFNHYASTVLIELNGASTGSAKRAFKHLSH